MKCPHGLDAYREDGALWHKESGGIEAQYVLVRCVDVRDLTPAEEYRLLFQSEPCDRLGCPNVADGDLTHFCRRHEDEFFRAERAEWDEREGRNRPVQHKGTQE